MLISNIFHTFAPEHLDVSIGVRLTLCGGCRSLLIWGQGNEIYGTAPYISIKFISGQLIGLMVRTQSLTKMLLRCKRTINVSVTQRLGGGSYLYPWCKRTIKESVIQQKNWGNIDKRRVYAHQLKDVLIGKLPYSNKTNSGGLYRLMVRAMPLAKPYKKDHTAAYKDLGSIIQLLMTLI